MPDGITEDQIRHEASEAQIPQQDISKFLTMSDFRVDFTRRRIAVFLTTGFLLIMSCIIMCVILWFMSYNVERGIPVDPTLGSILSGIVTAIYFNIGGIIASYLVVPAWERSNFRKNTNNIMQTLVQSKMNQNSNSDNNAKG